jgi:hypothetical protein
MRVRSFQVMGVKKNRKFRGKREEAETIKDMEKWENVEC